MVAVIGPCSPQVISISFICSRMQFNRSLFLFIFLLIFFCFEEKACASTSANIWPMPVELSTGANTLYLPTTQFNFTTFDASNEKKQVDIDTLNQAYVRYNEIIFNAHYHTEEDDNPASSLHFSASVEVFVDNVSEEYPQIDTDESYSLNIPSEDNGIMQINARTIYGAIRALESLSQLIVYDFDIAKYRIDVAPVVINDYPRFLHRGLMLDTARHYQSLAAIKKLVDSMSYAKFNVLHWHIVDTQSFSFQSVTYPDLWKGAYSQLEKYRQEDISDIVEFARLRGIKVMIEFDMPGHAGSWCVGYPEICPSASCLEPLDPSTNATFTLIDNLLAECSNRGAGEGLFPYSLLHLGGDEVDYSCWEKSDHIQEWAAEQGMQNSEEIYEYFVDRVAQLTRDQQRTPVQWVEVFEHFGSSLDKNTIIHVWKDKKELTDVINAGYQALLSDNHNWYLDHLETSWKAMYQNEPTEYLDESSDLSLLLGGEVCMWSEKVDVSDLENTVWPRAAAVAERLWTPQVDMDVDRAEARLEAFRCLLLDRGVAVAPVNNLRARGAPKAPGSCYHQRRRSL